MAMATRQRQEAMGARVAGMFRGMTLTAMRPIHRVARGTIIGVLDRSRQLAVDAVDVALRGVRNEVIGAFDYAVGFDGGNVRADYSAAVGQAAPVVPIARMRNDQAQAHHVRNGIVKVWILRMVVCVMMFSAGAIGHALWSSHGGNTCCACVSAPGYWEAGGMIPVETCQKRTIDVWDNAMPDSPKDQASSGGGKIRVLAFFDRLLKTEPRKETDVETTPVLTAGQDVVKGDVVSVEKRASILDTFKRLREIIDRVNAWRDSHAEMGDAFLQGPWVD